MPARKIAPSFAYRRRPRTGATVMKLPRRKFLHLAGRCGALGRLADRKGANLPVAASALDRRISTRRD